MEVIRASIRDRLWLERPRDVARLAIMATDVLEGRMPGIIIPAALLATMPLPRQLHEVTQLFPGYEPKGEVMNLSTPVGEAPFHTDYQHLLAEGTTHKLHQIPAAYRLGAVVTLGFAEGLELPSGTFIEEDGSGDIDLTLFEGQTNPGDVTLFNPRQPHRFATLGEQTEERPFYALAIGPKSVA